MARRRPNAELRSREHLTLDEVERLVTAAKDGRHGHRDATMLLVAYQAWIPNSGTPVFVVSNIHGVG